ncbi:neprilysin-1-like [Haemaphysalis longicornis]
MGGLLVENWRAATLDHVGMHDRMAFAHIEKAQSFAVLPALHDMALLPYAFASPAFHGDGTRAMNYGGLGTTVSLALSRLISLSYLQSPDVGQLPWSPKCASNESSQSVDDPFSDSLLLPLDVLAMRASFDAFLANREDERLEGFEAYTAEQMFFIASCYMSCQGSDLSWAMTSKHQCDGPLQNLNEFAMAFSCDPGSPMNPVEKCSIV